MSWKHQRRSVKLSIVSNHHGFNAGHGCTIWEIQIRHCGNCAIANALKLTCSQRGDLALISTGIKTGKLLQIQEQDLQSTIS